MNAEILQIISIAAFSISGLLGVIGISLFFKMDVRGILGDLSGKNAERQIRELRQQNRKTESKPKPKVIDAAVEREKPEGGTMVLLRGRERASRWEKEEETTILSGQKEMDEEGTTILSDQKGMDEEGTTILSEQMELDEEGTTILSNDNEMMIDEVIVHTRERI